MRRLLALFCMLALLLALPACTSGAPSPEASSSPDSVELSLSTEEQPLLRACVLYNGAMHDRSWEDAFSHLEQSLLLGMTVEAVDASRPFSLEGYDLLYPDRGLRYLADPDRIFAQIVSWVRGGGSVFLANEFYSSFSPEFLGAEYFVPLDALPQSLSYPYLRDDLDEIQELIKDFDFLYQQYTALPRLSTYSYGYAMVPSTATAIVKQGDLALYTMNQYGDGYVFFTNPLLPNEFYINGFSLTRRSLEQRSAANSTIAANQMIRNAFAAFVAKQKYGFSASRVFGSYGTPVMSWELHYEDITAFGNNAAEVFGELCKQNRQIPSFSFIRSPYWWFLRTESVTYLMGKSGETGLFLPDKYENAYSSGGHVAEGDVWLTLNSIEHGGSYFADYPSFGQRAYPYPCDWNDDSLVDLVVGGEDGLFHYYEGKGFSDRLHVAEGVLLTDGDGEPLSVGSYSAPLVTDLDRDGIDDLVSGSGDGKLWFFAGNGDGTFAPGVTLMNTGSDCQMFPELCDLDGDGLEDLLIGTNQGKLLLYPGQSEEFFSFDLSKPKDLSSFCSGLGFWLAPRTADIDGDGVPEILVGTFDGYVAVLKRKTAFRYLQDGFLSSTMYNYKGNQNVKFGNNCIPCLLDLDGDGTLDLLAGSLEYGLSYPTDSEYFPYREEFQERIDYVMDNHFYLSPHILTGEYVSDEWEEYEIAAHLRALDSYGAKQEYMGTNQHTWFTSIWSNRQTFENIWDAGLLWDSGFRFAKSGTDPQSTVENVFSLPFFLEKDGERTLLLQNCSTIGFADASWPDLSAKYGVPMCVYYHCDFAYQSSTAAKNIIQTVADFQAKHGYNFVREDQMMLGIAAAYDLRMSAHPESDIDSWAWTLSFSSADDGHPLHDDRYANACGIRIDLSKETARGRRFATDATVWRWDGRSTLYLSADKEVRIYQVDTAQTDSHLTQINLPADIELRENGATLTFLDDGMMDVVVSSEAETTSKGWSVLRRKDGCTQFTKYGQADTLELTFK